MAYCCLYATTFYTLTKFRHYKKFSFDVRRSCIWYVWDGSPDSAESRFHELLTIAELEIDFLMLAAVSYSPNIFYFQALCIECFVLMTQLDCPISGKINLFAERSIHYTILSSMSKYGYKGHNVTKIAEHRQICCILK